MPATALQVSTGPLGNTARTDTRKPKTKTGKSTQYADVKEVALPDPTPLKTPERK